MSKVVLGEAEVSMDAWFDKWCEERGGEVLVRDDKLLCVKEVGAHD